MTDAEKLARLAELSLSIAHRLYELRTWTARDKTRHREELAERDVLLSSVSPSYLHLIIRSRVVGEVRLAPAPWKLRAMTWLAQRI
jgi:hypothetical protein